MKNLMKILIAVVAGAFALSCVTDTTEELGVKVEGQGGVQEVAISLEQSRTQLGEKADGIYPLYWSEGDAIAINGVASNPLAAGGAANALFSFNQEVTRPYCVVYPATEGVGEGTIFPVTFAATQPYVEGTFASGVAPMYGYAAALAEGEAESAVQLNHLTGIIRLAIAGNGEKITNISVTTEKGKISGPFTIDCSNGTLTPSAEASNTVTVTFGDGLVLGAEATPIYIAVPAGSYGTFTITVESEAHGKMTLKFNSDAKPIAVGVVREFEAINFEANGSESEWFEIYNSADMLTFAKSAAECTWVGVKLMASVDMSEVDWTPIEGYTKIFDGNRDAGHKIIGLNAPLFGTTSATIKNLNLNVNIETESGEYYDSTTAILSLGGLARIATGPISDCTVSGLVYWNKKAANSNTYIFVGGVVGYAKEGASFTNVKNEANVTTTKANNTTFLGGITAMVGVSGGTTLTTFTNCENSGNITVEEKNYSTATNRNSYIGGLVGSTYIDITFTDCKNSGAVTHNNAYTKNAYVGGLFGSQFAVKNISFINCENTGAIYSNTPCRENAFIGGIFGFLKVLNTSTFNNLKNSGTITIEGNVVNRDINAGGICGDLTNNNEDVAMTVSNWYNSGIVNMNAGGNYKYDYDQKAGGYTLYLGGTFGNATRVNLDNIDNAGDVIYGKDATFCTTPSGNPNICIGCIGGQRVTGFVQNCDNSGTLYLRASNPKYHHHIGGLFGQLNAYAAEVKNCTNSGNIEAESTFAPLRCRLAGLVGVLYNSIVSNCVNSGNINYNGATTATNQMYIGGCVGYGYSASSGRFKVERLSNSGKITINTGTNGKTASICIAGIFGSIQKVYNDTDYVKDCVNVGDIEFNLPTDYTSVDIAGIIAHYNTTNAKIAYSGHKQYSTIKAMGRSMDEIGAIIGVVRDDSRAVSNCEVGGKIITKSETVEDGEDASGNKEYITVETPGAITAENWYNYIYAGGTNTWADDTYDGCSLLESKPAVDVVTTPQPSTI